MAKRKTIASFGVALTARTEKFNKGIKKALASIRKFGRSVKKLAKQLRLFKLAFAAVAAATATGVLIKRQTAFNAKLLDTQARLGFTVEQINGLRVATERLGVPFVNTVLALQRFVRRIGEAAVGTGEARGALKRLGLDAVKLAKQDPFESFLETAQALQEVENIFERTSLAMKLLDIEGVDLARVMAQLGRLGLLKAAAASKKFGLANQKSAELAKAATIAMVDLKFSMEGLVVQMSEVSSRWLLMLTDMQKNMKSDLPNMGEVLENVFQFVGFRVAALADAFVLLKKAVASASLATLKSIRGWVKLAEVTSGNSVLMDLLGMLPGGVSLQVTMGAITAPIREAQLEIGKLIDGFEELQKESNQPFDANIVAFQQALDKMDGIASRARANIKKLFAAMGGGVGIPLPASISSTLKGGTPQVLKAVSGLSISSTASGKTLGTSSNPMKTFDVGAQRRLDMILFQQRQAARNTSTAGP